MGSNSSKSRDEHPIVKRRKELSIRKRADAMTWFEQHKHDIEQRIRIAKDEGRDKIEVIVPDGIHAHFFCGAIEKTFGVKCDIYFGDDQIIHILW